MEHGDASLQTGTVVGERYRIERSLGRGGAGAVFEAVDVQSEERVALKMLRTDKAGGREVVQRFYREAQTIRRLQHPSIVAVRGFGVDGESQAPFLAMELVEGQNLRELLDQVGKLPERQCAAVGVQVAEALVCAHQGGVVHRDLKPANLMLVETPQGRRIKVVDFGLAKLFDADGDQLERLTRTGQMLGTPHYMSPEQIRGQATDFGTDLYSLGCVLFEMLAGVRPYESKRFVELMRLHLTAPLPLLPSKLEDGDAPSIAMRRLIGTMLAKKSEDRPGSAGLVVVALEKIAKGSATVVATMVTPTALQTINDPADVDDATMVQPKDLVPTGEIASSTITDAGHLPTVTEPAHLGATQQDTPADPVLAEVSDALDPPTVPGSGGLTAIDAPTVGVVSHRPSDPASAAHTAADAPLDDSAATLLPDAVAAGLGSPVGRPQPTHPPPPAEEPRPAPQPPAPAAAEPPATAAVAPRGRQLVERRAGPSMPEGTPVPPRVVTPAPRRSSVLVGALLFGALLVAGTAFYVRSSAPPPITTDPQPPVGGPIVGKGASAGISGGLATGGNADPIDVEAEAPPPDGGLAIPDAGKKPIKRPKDSKPTPVIVDAPPEPEPPPPEDVPVW